MVAETRDLGAAPGSRTPGTASSAVRRRRLRALASPPIVVFGAAEVTALFVWLHISRNAWFDLDEWDFLVQRRAGDLGDLFRPHNGHWTTLPILVYRFFYATFGLRTYFPYRFLAIVLYLVSAALLLVVIRRTGVNPWIATAAASLYAFFGFGWANIIRGFQITLTGSVVFGLAHLLLTDHDGPVDRRDGAGIVAGFAGLLCSGLAVLMVVIVGIAALFKRGWRVALLHTAPFFGVYLVWLVTIGRTGGGGIYNSDPATIGRIAWDGWSVSADRLAPAGHGLLLAIVLVAGFAVAVVARRRAAALGQLVVPVTMFVTAAVFLGMSAAFNRRNITFERAFATQERYVSVAALLMIPALAVAVDALVRRWRWLLPIALVLLIAAIPRNLDYASNSQRGYDFVYAGTRLTVVTLAESPFLQSAPRTLEPERSRSWRITAAWLRDAAADGKVPRGKPLNPLQVYATKFRLSFDLQPVAAPTTNCTVLNTAFVYQPKKGDVIGLYDNAVFIQPRGFVPVFPPVVFGPETGRAIVVLNDLEPATIGWFRGGFFSNIDSFNGFPRICIRGAGGTAPTIVPAASAPTTSPPLSTANVAG
jgi:hypothetical protein